MSYRINLYGYRRSQMRALFGSGDRSALERLTARVDGKEAFADEIDRNQSKEVIIQAINKGVPFANLDFESHIHTWAASLMAQDEQDWLHTNCSYHWEAIGAFRKRARKYARPDVRAFITGLNEGVPIFGQRIADHSSPYYASFALSKIIGFHEGLQQLQDAMPPPSDDDPESLGLHGFVCDLIDYLRQIKDAQLDCWYMTG